MRFSSPCYCTKNEIKTVCESQIQAKSKLSLKSLEDEPQITSVTPVQVTNSDRHFYTNNCMHFLKVYNCCVYRVLHIG